MVLLGFDEASEPALQPLAAHRSSMANWGIEFRVL